MLYIKDQRAAVWKIEDKGNYTLVQLSTGRKDKKTEKYVNSSWSFVRFVGKAHESAGQLERGSQIVFDGGLSKEPYEKDGETVYPQNPSFVVFEWKFKENNGESGSKENKSSEPKEDEYPF